jgi:hypothetical protein
LQLRCQSVACHLVRGTQTLVVIDSARVQGIHLGQISDYVAMVGLVDVDVDANLEDAPSILRLFTAPPSDPPEGPAEWDRAFLSALYHTDQRSALQRGQIARTMVEEIARYTPGRPGAAGAYGPKNPH